MFAPGEVQPAPPQGQVFPPEPEAPKKFSSPGIIAQGRAQFIPNDFVHAEPYEQVCAHFVEVPYSQYSTSFNLKTILNATTSCFDRSLGIRRIEGRGE